MSLNQLINPLGAGLDLKVESISVALAAFTGPVAVRASTAINLQDSDRIVAISAPSPAANVILTLPPVSNVGVSYRFRLVANMDAAHTVAVNSSEGTNIWGTLNLGPTGTFTRLNAAGASGLVFAATAVMGDSLNFESDGNEWMVSGDSFTAAGITAA
jgi:hypothetical protein